MGIKERIQELGGDLRRKLYGPSIDDHDFPDPRPENPVRDRFEAAEQTAGIQTKEGALNQITKSRVGLLGDYEYQASYHQVVEQMAAKKALELGATEKEIEKAGQIGDVIGARVRANVSPRDHHE